MGYEQVKGVRAVTHRNLWGGWFPNKLQEEIPGNLFDPSQPIGFRDCNGVIYYQDRLRRMFGAAQVSNSVSALPTSIFYSRSLAKCVGTAGTDVYYDMNLAVPVSITGTATVTGGVLTDITDWQFETDVRVIGCQRGNPPWTWTGTGNAAALGGSPPQGRWVKTWQNAVWIANTSGEPSTIFFSNLGDPAVWTTNDDYKFDAPITGLGILGSMMVVFMEDHIGILTGGNNRILTKVDRFINSVGCNAGFSIKNAYIQGTEVLIFHGPDGFYAFDGSQQLLKLSKPMENKYGTGTASSRWNTARFDQIQGTYASKYSWYIASISDGSSAANDTLVILDLSRPYPLPNNSGLTVPHWPYTLDPFTYGTTFDCIAYVPDENNVSWVYFAGGGSTINRFNPAISDVSGSFEDLEQFATSKIFDPEQTLVLMESNVNATAIGSNSTVTENINFDQASGLGESASVAMYDSTSSVLDTTFILDTSTVDTEEFVFKNFPISNWGRFFQFNLTLGTNNPDVAVEIIAVNFVFKSLGLTPNAGF